MVFLSTSPKARRYPLSYVYSGTFYFNVGSLNLQDSYGYLWSASAISDSEAYRLNISSNGSNPQNSANKTNGFTLRSTIARRYPLSYVYTDFFDFSGGYMWYQSHGGYYWTRTIYTTGQAYFLTINTGLNPQFYASYSAGMALRCGCSNSIKARRYPLSYVMSGQYWWDDGQLRYQGNNGYAHTATAYTVSDNYFLGIYGGTALAPQNIAGKTFGFPLRFTSARRYPLSYVYSGNYYWYGTSAGQLVNQGYLSDFATSTNYQTTQIVGMRISSSGVFPQDEGDDKRTGFPLRRRVKPLYLK